MGPGRSLITRGVPFTRIPMIAARSIGVVTAYS